MFIDNFDKDMAIGPLPIIFWAILCSVYSLKLAHLIHERSGAKIYNFYIDMRSFGKGYEEFYNRLLEEGVRVHPRPRGGGRATGP